MATGTLLMSGIYIPEGEEETGVVNLRYGVFSWMDIGAGYAVEAERPIWSLRLQPISENEEGWRPAFILGTGSVQTGNSAFLAGLRPSADAGLYARPQREKLCRHHHGAESGCR